MKILIVDDHAILRKGIRSILEESPVVESVGEAANGHEAVAATRGEHFDVVLLDISMPGKDGLETLKQLKYEHPEQRVLMLTMHPEDRYAIRALKAGAAGYLLKNCSPEELVRAVRECGAGGRYISPRVAMALAEALDTTTNDSPHARLSDRELQVMRLLASAWTVTEIAAELNLSDKTVTTYKARILEKLHLRNTAELIRHAIENGLV